jgi:hypothetical protein
MIRALFIYYVSLPTCPPTKYELSAGGQERLRAREVK